MPIENTRLSALDLAMVRWMARRGPTLLRISLGVVFLWFGALKLVPGVSPAEGLATRTISTLTFGAVPPAISLPALALWECAIGAGLLAGKGLRAVLLLLWLQMLGTLSPLFLFPQEVFVFVPWAPTLEGQYIIKNLVLVSASLVVGATVRGGVMTTGESRLG
jgi:uncharacterized membrane protein YkgB